MQKKRASQSAFFNPRVLIAFALCSIGALLAVAGLSKSVTAGMTKVSGANPVPLINQPLVPDAVAPGGAAFTLTVNGTGFASGSVVNWNGSVRTTTFVRSSQLTASILASDIATASTASVTVVNPGAGGISNVVYFLVTNSTSSVMMEESSVIGTSSAETATVGDFNGDGKQDLAVSGRFSSVLSILLGNGDGSFQPRVDYEVGMFARWVITGDFNGDGKLDLACGGDLDARVSILLGQGDGTFQSPALYATGAGSHWGVVADFNADSKPDLAVAGEGKVSILLGNGDGTFGAHLDYGVGGGYMWVGVGDFNGDGKLDLAVGQTDAPNVSILLGNGDGTFQPHVDYPTGPNPRSLAVGDLNGDGKLDLAVAADSSGQASILLGNGDGTFQPHVDYATVSAPVWISLGDFNGDGKLDLALSSFAGLGIGAAILLGNGDGTFQRPLSSHTSGGRVESGTVADFDGDGRLDLAVANSDSNTVSILLQTEPSGTNPVPLVNQPLVPDAIAPGGAAFTLTVNGTGFVSGSVVNWNGSARATTFVNGSQLTASILASDIATASTASVTVVNPSPGGGTSNVAFFPITLASSSVSLSRADVVTGLGPYSIIAADFNGDGKLDLCTGNTLANTFSMLLGNGDGTFQPHVENAASHPTGLGDARDFNGDGKLDLAMLNGFIANTVSILLGNGDGTFQPPVDYATGSVPLWLTTGDFDGDGNLDLAVADFGNFNGRKVSILLGNGDGTFRPHVDYSTGGLPRSVTTGDFNGDGKLDLALVNSADNTVSILLGNGDGTFQPHIDYATGSTAFLVTTGDFNADGKLDLAVTDDGSNTVSILLGVGDGTFPTHVEYATGGDAGYFTMGDVNGDGILDLVVVHSPSNTVSVLLGVGDGTFPTHVEYATGSGASYVTIGDFNEDGRLDLAIANLNDNTVSVLLQSTTVALSDTSLDFGLQLVGTASSPQEVTLTNTGPITLTISSITASGDFLERNNCGSSLPAGESCTVRIVFKPTGNGTRRGNVTITDNAADSPQLIALAGTGTVVQLTPSSLDFGDERVGTVSRPRRVILTNTGSTPLSIQGIGITGTDFGDFVETTTCGSSVPAHTSCEIDVRFAPSDIGTRRASMKVRHDGGGDQPVRLRGTGVSN